MMSRSTPPPSAPRKEEAPKKSIAKTSRAPHLPIEVGLAHLGKVLWRWRRGVRIRRPTDRSRYGLPHRRRVLVNDGRFRIGPRPRRTSDQCSGLPHARASFVFARLHAATFPSPSLRRARCSTGCRAEPVCLVWRSPRCPWTTYPRADRAPCGHSSFHLVRAGS